LRVDVHLNQPPVVPGGPIEDGPMALEWGREGSEVEKWRERAMKIRLTKGELEREIRPHDGDPYRNLPYGPVPEHDDLGEESSA
jgi:hypothetical protein